LKGRWYISPERLRRDESVWQRVDKSPWSRHLPKRFDAAFEEKQYDSKDFIWMGPIGTSLA
jgi:hypothetical protein